MKKFFKRAGIILLVLIAIMMIYAVMGLKKTTTLAIENIDLSQISDGSFVGSYDCYRWTNKVEVTVEAQRITNIRTIKEQDGRKSLIRELSDSIISLQRTDVDVVTGATASSNAFLKAVEIALKNAAAKP